MIPTLLMSCWAMIRMLLIIRTLRKAIESWPLVVEAVGAMASAPAPDFVALNMDGVVRALLTVLEVLLPPSQLLL